MEKFSVKKPYTILVAVIMVLALGAISVYRMKTELLPDFSIPYMLVITTYVGASPETVEAGVTEPLESELGTISGVENVTSYSMENYSLIQLEFEEDTDMDSALVKISSAINEIESSLPDMAGTPLIMELSMDMVATMYVGVGYEGYDIYELTDYVSDEVIPYLERQEGVASVSSVGLVEETVVVELNQKKIDDLNDEILATVNEELADAKEMLDDAQEQVDEALEALEDSQAEVAEMISAGIFDSLSPTVEDAADSLSEEIVSLQAQIEDLKSAVEELRDADPEEAKEELLDTAEAVADLLTTLTKAMQTVVEDAAQDAVSAAFSSLSDDLGDIAGDAVDDLSDLIDTDALSDAMSSAMSSAMDSLTESVEDATSDLSLQDAADALESAASASAEDLVNSITAALSESLSEDVVQELYQECYDAIMDFLEAAVGSVDSDESSGLTEDDLNELLNALSSAASSASSILSSTATNVSTAADTSISNSLDSLQSDVYAQLEDLADTLSDILSEAMSEAIETAVSGVSDSLSSDDVSDLTESLVDSMGDAVSDAVSEAVSAAASSLSSSSVWVSSMVSNSEAATDIKAIASEVEEAVADASDSASGTLDDLIDQLDSLSSQLDEAVSMMDNASDTLDTLETAYATLTQAQLTAAVELATYTVQLTEAQAALEEAQDAFEEQREIALESADVGELLSMSTLATLIYAQNFSMPAGYISDEDDNSWLLKIGDEYESAEELAQVLLVDNETIGVIRLEDVADITVIDNSDESYATLNAEDGIVLMIYKSSAYGTNEVSTACNEALEELAEGDDNFTYMILMDQGSYIDMVVESVLMSMLMGGILAIIVLALFLKDIKPTLVVAISIPLSVLLALVLLYFTGLELNVMTLSGLALGIGMLVDNSIVVLENILRLRNSGFSAPHAAVQGAKQVRSAITASTLTTICVFLPVVFTDGTVRTLLVPLALSIGYCLVASLAIALTVVPAATSTIFRDIKPKEYKLLSRIQDKYEVSLRWCLRHKAVPLGFAIGLFVVTVYAITQMGIVFFPDITSNAVTVSIETPETDTQEESFAKADEIAELIMQVDSVENVGIMSADSTTSMMGISVSTGTSSYGSYTCYVTIPENLSQKEVQAICDAIEEAVAPVDAVVEASASGMSELTSLFTSSGLTVNIYGEDLDTLQEIGADVEEIVLTVEGFEIPEEEEEAEASLHLVIDKDKAMSYGLTVAQVYTEVATALTTSAVSTTIWVDSVELDVEVLDETDLLTVENLMDMEFDVSDSTDTSVDYSEYESLLSLMDEDGEEEEDDSDGSESESDVSDDSGSDSDAEGSEGDSGVSDDSGSESGSGDSDAESGDGSDADESGSDFEEDSGEDADDSEEEEDDGIITLGEIATLEVSSSLTEIDRENQTRFLSVTADVLDGYNTTLLSRELSPLLSEYEETLPYGYSIEISGESSQISEMVSQIVLMAILGFLFIYLIMVAEFQSLKSPFIVIFTIPLAFTGGMLGLLIAGQQLSILSLIGFIVLMGTVVNNGIVFVDYTNQLRLGGLSREDALCATGRTRMRPIVMTALTTILALGRMIIGTDMASQLGGGMSIVIAGGLLYATFMTLYIIPTIYDIFFKGQPLNVDTGDDLEDVPDDAAEYLRLHGRAGEIGGEGFDSAGDNGFTGGGGLEEGGGSEGTEI